MPKQEMFSRQEILFLLFGESDPAPQGLLAKYGPTLTVQDLCAITGLSEKTIRARLSKGEIPGKLIGRRWIIPTDTFDDYLHNRLNPNN